MAVALMARKLGMTQIFAGDGKVVAVTALQAGPCLVVGMRTQPKDGYSALILAFDQCEPKRLNKPQAGIFKKAQVPAHRSLFEARTEDLEGYAVGQEIRCDIFSEGDLVDVRGTSKGKGFAGQIKRHGFSRGPESHGSMNVRQAGSIGATDAAKVVKGMRMAGHMGAQSATAANLKVVSSDPDRNLILVRGQVPGASNGRVVIRLASSRQRRGRA